MKQILLILVVVALIGCGETSWVSNPSNPNNVLIEKAIRKQLKKVDPTHHAQEGELTKADLEKITHLNLYGNKLTEVPKELEKLTQLRVLNLYDNQLTDGKGLEKLTQLETLRLSDNQLTDVKGLEKLTQLKTLHFDGNKLTDVKGLEKLTQLWYLSLNDNQLTDVKGLEKLDQLTHLYLNDNPDLTKAQIAELRKALPKCYIYSNPTK